MSNKTRTHVTWPQPWSSKMTFFKKEPDQKTEGYREMAEQSDHSALPVPESFPSADEIKNQLTSLNAKIEKVTREISFNEETANGFQQKAEVARNMMRRQIAERNQLEQRFEILSKELIEAIRKGR